VLLLGKYLDTLLPPYLLGHNIFMDKQREREEVRKREKGK
jgi:hypothetical protein